MKNMQSKFYLRGVKAHLFLSLLKVKFINFILCQFLNVIIQIDGTYYLN